MTQSNERAKIDTCAVVSAPSTATVTAAVMILAATWFAAGSVGLLGAALLRALSYTALIGSTALIRPDKRHFLILASIAAIMLLLPIVLGVERSTGYDVLFVAAVAGVLAVSTKGIDRFAMAAAAWAASAMAVFCVARESVPAVWHVYDWLGRALGEAVGAIVGRPLWLGGSFAGLDFIVAMLAFYVVWLCATPRPRRRRAVCAAIAILAVQAVYLLFLSQAERLIAALPELPPPPPLDPAEYQPPAWSLAAGLRSMIPWNLPFVAFAGDLLVASLMLRWAAWPTDAEEMSDTKLGVNDKNSPAKRYPFVVAVAVLTAVTMAFAPCRNDLSGKKILAYAESDVWWLPGHDTIDLSAADAYGMLPVFVAGLGGEFEETKALSQDELDAADVLIMVDPAEPLPSDALRRVHEFIGGGGSLLLIAGPADASNHAREATDAILEPTGMSVRFDMVVSETPHWQDACRPMVHPATAGVDARRNQFGLNLGSSIGSATGRLPVPASPLLVGRWGWCEPGSDMLATNMGEYDEGEKLGDIVLAAESPLGKGTVVVLGDDTALANISLVYSHPFAARLLCYLTDRSGNPQRWWRQTLAVLWMAALAWLVIGQRREAAYGTTCRDRMNRLIVAAVSLGFGLACCASISRGMGEAIVSGQPSKSRPIAYIDAAHLDMASDEPWTGRGVGGFAITLMRNGYMPLMLYEMDYRRLQTADMLVVAGPSREFSTSQRDVAVDFVDSGGLLVCCIGAEQSAVNRKLLADFGFVVPHSPVEPDDDSPEPAPISKYPDDFGRAFIPYINAKDYGKGDYMAYTCIHQPWPVECVADQRAVDPILHGYNGQTVAAACHHGKGCALVVGDSHFVLNENHGYVDGRAVDGTASNLDFWHWCLGRVTGSHDWFPPDRMGREEPAQSNPLRQQEVEP